MSRRDMRVLLVAVVLAPIGATVIKLISEIFDESLWGIALGFVIAVAVVFLLGGWLFSWAMRGDRR